MLRLDGFVPLHYELYWLLARKCSLTPAVLRLVPAVAGTLMVPAMYFLARQLVTRRAALLVAAFTACSAWLMVFSHDAKMYSHFWLFVVLHVACLMWWMRTGLRVAYWCMVAAGCAMAGLHATGLIVLGLDVVLFLAHPRTTWRRALAFVAGVLLISAGPAGYYLGFNRFADTVQANWDWSGIQWIEQRNRGHSTPELLADTGAAYLFGFNFVSESMFHSEPPGPTPRWIVIGAWGVLGSLLALALLGGVPWRSSPSTSSSPLAPLPPPLVLFYLATWLCVPAYIFYCASVLGFASPFALLPWYLWALIAAVMQVALVHFPGTRPHAWRVVLPVVAPVLLCGGVYLAMRGRVPPGSIWMPRYLGIIFPALAIAVCALFVRLPRPLRYVAVGLLLGVNAAQSVARLVLSTEPPISRVAADVWRGRDPGGDTLTYAQVRSGFGPPGAGTITNVVGLYHLRLLSGRVVRPVEFRFASADRITPIRRFSDASLVAWDVEASPAVRTVVLWVEADATTADTERRILSRLGPGWRLRSTDDYPVRIYWTWQPVYTYRRDVFEKT